MSKGKLKLGVNIDHVATLRKVRGTDYPSVVEAARLCENAGAHSITVHLREDRRHICDGDVYALRKNLRVRMNLEMANSPEILAIALKVRPDEVCLVPEKRRELTTEGGLDVAGQMKSLSRTVAELSGAGIDVSLFVDPEEKQLKAAAGTGARWIELHTGCFCNAKGREAGRELARLIRGAVFADRLGLNVNAGHGINLDNIDGILKIPCLKVLNIGHSIISRALFVGMRAAVKEMMDRMARYRNASGGRGGMKKRCGVLGTGIDIVENERMREMLKRWSGAFKDRVFLRREQEYCDSKAMPCRHYAGRFAVKEAVSKAFGTGVGPHVSWLDIEVVRDRKTGAPSVMITGKAARFAQKTGVKRILISLSHTKNYAIANALLLAD